MHFAHLREAGPERIEFLVGLAAEIKRAPRHDRPLEGLAVALCFADPSLRTRASLDVAASALGAHPVSLQLGAETWKIESRRGVVMDAEAAEHVREAVPVLSRYFQALALRCFGGGRSWAEDREEPLLAAFRALSRVPVVNMESATGHPLQGLADLLTIRERMDPRGKRFLLTWVPHVRALPPAVAHTAVEIASLAGMSVTIARPPGFDLDPELLERARTWCRARGAGFEVTDDVERAYEGAHVVYAKSWGSLERYGQPPPQDPGFRARWIVDEAKMRRTEGAIFMHCLPVRRNLEVTDGVLDSPASAVVDQAENRLHTAKAVLLHLLGASGAIESSLRSGA